MNECQTKHSANILVVDDTPENLRLLVDILTAQGYDVSAAADGHFALQTARATFPTLILLDVRMADLDGYAVCAALKAEAGTRDIPVIFISALHDLADKVKGFEAGGVDYITKPFQAEEVVARVETHLTLHRLRHHLAELVAHQTSQLQAALAEIQRLQAQLQAENLYLREEIQREHNVSEIIGRSDSLQSVFFRARQVALTNTTVLITGETGVGKELVARAIHQASPRKDRPLIKVNCATLPAHLIESELFGHEKGAFTGAHARQIGRFELAHQGTIFLDEIGELPPELQPKLLRVLQDGEFERLGNSRTMTVDVRVIAATNRDLEAAIRAGRFRQDLYYRLNIYPILVPPLRERPADIPLLVQACVQRFNKKLGKQIDVIPQATMNALQQYAWPGNVRELENVIERALIVSQEAALSVELPENPIAPVETVQTLDGAERAHILRALTLTKWRIEGPRGAAVLLDLNPSTLRGRMRKLGIQKPGS